MSILSIIRQVPFRLMPRALVSSMLWAGCLCVVLTTGNAQEPPQPAAQAVAAPKDGQAPEFTAVDRDDDGAVVLKEYLGDAKGAERSRLRRRFYDRDVNSDQQLSKAEFEVATPQRQLRSLNEFRYRDLDQSERLERKEFLAMAGEKNQASAARDFAIADRDGDQVLTLVEFQTLPAWTPHIERKPVARSTVVELQSMLAQIRTSWKDWDRNGNGELEQDELIAAPLERIVPPLAKLNWKTWDRDESSAVSLEEFQHVTEVASGVRRPEGDALTTDSGLVFNWEHFKHFDRNRDGSISRAEFLQFRVSSASESQAAEWFQALDSSADEQLSFAEWSTLEKPQVYGGRVIDPLQEFLRIDKDYDGRVSRQEMLDGAPAFMRRVTQFLFPGFDTDGDGYFSLDEFCDTPPFNRLSGWQAERNDADTDGRLSLAEFMGEPEPVLVAVFHRYFHRLDLNRDGYLDPSEYFYRSAQRIPALELSRLDADGNKELTQAEFMTGVAEDKQAARQRDFVLLDFNQDGALQLAEFTFVAPVDYAATTEQLPDPVNDLYEASAAALEPNWKVMDADGSGELSASEFEHHGFHKSIVGLGDSPFSDWDGDASGGITAEEARLGLKIAFGLQLRGGEPLRTRSGRVFDVPGFLFRDRDRDGVITWPEFEARTTPKGAEGKKRFDSVDADRDEKLTFLEYSLFAPRQPLEDFRRYDTDLNAKLSPEEWTKGLPTYMQEINPYVFAAFDADQDQAISLAEYRLSPMGNSVAPWNEARNDRDNDGLLTVTEFRWRPGLELAALTGYYFRTLDRNHDQRLDLDEFPFRTSKRDPERDFQRRDLDRDGKLSESEYLAFVAGQPGLRDLAVFDFNRDSALSLDEYRCIPHLNPRPVRGSISDPLVVLAESYLSQVAAAWKSWDADGNQALNGDEFAAATIANIVPALSHRSADVWDLNADGQISQDEVRQTVETAFGIRRPGGDLLRLPSGRVVLWEPFKALDRNHDDQLNFEEAVTKSWEKQDAEPRFRLMDANSDSLVTFSEWAATEIRGMYPVESFLSADKDNDGRLNPAELLTVVPQHYRATWANHLLPGFDRDGDGSIGLDEYRLMPMTNPQLSWHSPRTDSNKNGYLELQEFRWGDDIDAVAVAADFFARLDVDHDQRLDLNEFTFTTSKRDPQRDFRKLDQDSDGTVTEAELLASLADKSKHAAELRDFRLFDLNADQKLSYEEYLRIPARVPLEHRRGLPDPVLDLIDNQMQQIQAQLKRLDQNTDGELDRQEFDQSQIARTVRGLELTGFLDWDRDRDGNVSLDDCRRTLEIGYGIVRLDGQPLRTDSGVVYNLERFEYLDVGHDGRITLDEFRKRHGDSDAIRKQFEDTDANRDGAIEFQEAIAVANGRIEPIVDFLRMDANLDGTVSQQELVERASTWKMPVVQVIFPGFDTDGSGGLSIGEYLLTPLAHPFQPWWSRPSDRNNDGYLSRDEFRWSEGIAFASLCLEFFDRFDVDDDQRLGLNEFPFRINPAKVPRDVTFSYRDTDADGKLSLDEALAELVAPNRERTPQVEQQIARIEDAFRAADANADDYLDRTEFQSEGSEGVVNPAGQKRNLKSKLPLPEQASQASGSRQWAIVAANVVLVLGVAVYLLRKK